jgi:hypothetical protein
MIQSILIPKKTFTLNKALKWLDKHNYKHNKIRETKSYYRFRQTIPKYPANYYSEKLNNGVVLVYFK